MGLEGGAEGGGGERLEQVAAVGCAGDDLITEMG